MTNAYVVDKLRKQTHYNHYCSTEAVVFCSYNAKDENGKGDNAGNDISNIRALANMRKGRHGLGGWTE